MPERTVAGLPVSGDIVGKYLVVQLSPSGQHWDIKGQRFQLDHCYQCLTPLDVTRPTRIVQVGRNPELSIIRCWN